MANFLGGSIWPPPVGLRIPRRRYGIFQIVKLAQLTKQKIDPKIEAIFCRLGDSSVPIKRFKYKSDIQ